MNPRLQGVLTRSHHPFSPSAFGRRLQCRGSYRLEAGQPDNAGEAAMRGTLCHHEIPFRGTSDVLTADENGMVQRARDWLAALGNGAWEYETWMPFFEEETQEVVYFGWADAILVLPGVIKIAEFKFGWSDLDQVFAGAQLALLKLAAHQIYGLPVEGYLYCARSDEQFESVEQNYAEMAATVKKIIAESQAPDAPVTPGPSQCRYCKGLAACQEARLAVEKVVHDKTALTPTTRAQRRVFMALVQDWLERVRLDDWQYMHSGGELPGYHLQSRSGNRKIDDPSAAYQALSGLLTEREFISGVDARVTKLESLAVNVLVNKGACKTKQEAQRHFAALLGDVISRDAESTFIAKDRK